MRKIMLSAVVATVAAVSFAAPSQAGGVYFGFGHGHHHGGYVTVYDGYGYGHCHWKKIRRYNKWGDLVIKRVRVCR
ncbi:hypothetical protein LXM94_14690 [Rhizobium sp. TRM95111]|uniref:hypothetical protein n=1 Tax=Rhizobium alarense TaxID=2846851 RepID=UPI001F3DADA6|nr:hypothetical protein [Rhizobium alarense]MCF3641221.1 hypothetical protein [Rhizobium alarense]